MFHCVHRARKLSRISRKANTFARVMFRAWAREWAALLDQLVFIDETSKKRASIDIQYGWAKAEDVRDRPIRTELPFREFDFWPGPPPPTPGMVFSLIKIYT